MVSKEELFAKYKELKAQGVAISLIELKKQLENGENEVYQHETPVSTNCGTNTTQETPQTTTTNSQWTTYTLNQSTSPASYSGNLNNVTTPENNNYSNNFSGNFSFSSNSVEPQNQTQSSQESVNAPYTGNISQNQAQNLENQNIKYCLIGYPLGHSLSAYIHNAGFKSLGIDTTYEILETPPEDLVDRIKQLRYNDYAGFNVTIPLKLPITVFLDEIDSSADVVGAINTVVIKPDKTLKGYNTDVIGFRNAIPSNFSLLGKVAGVLGTGGAARAAITALAQAQVKQIKIYTRNIPNSLNLLNFVRKKFPKVEFNAFQIERIRDLSDINILVNTTPIGMLGHSGDMTPVEENELKTLPQGALVYDVIYNPKKTVLLKLAQKHGYQTINGIDMLIHQALAAEEIWTGKTPDFKDMKIAALENL